MLEDKPPSIFLGLGFPPRISTPIRSTSFSNCWTHRYSFSIEEKSLGCISKAGSAPLQDIVDFAEEIPGKGYYFMDLPGNDIECVSGMAAAGVHLVCFTTGRGTPTGNPIIPVIKITGNELTAKRMADNMDVDTSPVLHGIQTLDESGQNIYEMILNVANGQETKSEILGHQEFSISRIGISL
jgi:altronate dehydratase large subunit